MEHHFDKLKLVCSWVPKETDWFVFEPGPNSFQVTDTKELRKLAMDMLKLADEMDPSGPLRGM